MEIRTSAKSGIHAMNQATAKERFLLKNENLADLPDKVLAKRSLETTVGWNDPRQEFNPLVNHIWYDQNE